MYQVYLIDDEPWVLIGLERLISWEEYGFCVVGKSTSSKEAWSQITQLKPDVVVTDIRMPGLNGLDLLGKIREENLNTKVVLVSGFAEFEYARIAIRDGAFEYLVKPVSKDQLSDCMKRLSKELTALRAETDTLAVSETIDMISKYKNASSAWAFLCDMHKTKINKRRFYMASLYRFEDDQKLICAQNISETVFDASIVPIAKNELFAVIGSDFCELPQYHAKRILDYIKKICDTSSTLIFCGCSQIYEEEIQVYKMFGRAKNACDSAQFVTESIETLEHLVTSGKILLDELWRYFVQMNRVYAKSQNGKYIDERECESAEELLVEYKNARVFFEMLKNKLVFNEAARLMEQIREYIDCHYMENLTAAALGNEIGISQGYLSQLIKKETGKTYSELIQQKKLEKAKELLQYSEKTVGEIAQETGYSDYYYFTKTFKRLTKMTPSEYRKKYEL